MNRVSEGIFFMLGGGSGCDGCGVVGGWIGFLWFLVLCCCKDFHSSDCIKGSKIIGLQYPMLVLLIFWFYIIIFELFFCH